MKTNLQKRILSLLLAVIMAVGMVPMTVIPTYAATTADGLTYEIENDEVTVTGYTGSSSFVTVPDTIEGYPVTAIGDNAFYEQCNLESVILPDSIKRIGCFSFFCCCSLTDITLPKCLETIESGAFCYSYLKKVSVPEGVISIGSDAFNGCSQLTDVTLPRSVISISGGAFDFCDRLTTIYYNGTEAEWQSVSLGSDALGYYPPELIFLGLSDTEPVPEPVPEGLTFELNNEEVTIKKYTGKAVELKIPESIEGYPVTKISNFAFSACFDLSSITIPDTVTVIGEAAFNYCQSLTDITIPCSVTTIGSSAFNHSGLVNIVIPDTVTSIGNSLFQYCSSLESVTLPSGLSSIPDYTFYDCKKLSEVTIPEGVTSIGYNAFNNSGIAKIDIPENVTTIGNYAFSNCNSLESIYVPESVTSIGNYAFSSCKSLESITLPDKLTSISTGMFTSCQSLTSITLPESITKIGSSAFNGCTALTSIYIPDSVTSIGGNAFSNCKSLTSVKIPAEMTSIDDYAFSGSYITSIDIPENITKIGNYAFSSCSALSSVTIPDTVTAIGDAAFYYCQSLTDITIPCSVTTIGSSAFNHSGLVNIVIPDTVTSIGNSLFQYCSSLESVTLPAGLSSIPDYTFYDCKKLSEVTIPEGVTSIGYGAFNYSGLAKIDIPENVTTIGNYAFSNCNSLESIYVPESVTSIGNYAFSSCKSLESITLPDKLTSISTGMVSSCQSLTSITLPESITKIGSSAFNGCTALTSIYIPDSVTSIGGNAFSNCKSLTSVKIPAEMTSIDDYAFSGSHITSIDIPENITKIGNYAFSSCSDLSSVTIPDTVTAIGDAAFYYCQSLTDITIPCSVTTIGSSAFNHSGLVDIVIPDTVTIIGNSLFQYCSNLESVTLPSGLSAIPDYTFYDCQKLSEVTIPEGVTSIGYRAFNYSGLAKIDIPENVTTIGSYAFSNCNSLESIYVPESVTSIGSYAFYPCKSLTKVFYGGTETAWKNISIGNNNDSLTALVPIYFGDHEHEFVVTVISAPTCTQEGAHYKECSVCTFSYTDTIDPLGHEYVATVTPPTCTESGYTTHSCIRCSKSYNDEFVSSVGHSFGSWIEKTAPTCTSSGIRYRVCSGCERTESESIPRSDHDFGDWTVDRPATLLLEGNKHRECSACGLTQIEEIERIHIDYTETSDYGFAVFTVVSAQTLEPIENAQIFISTESDGENTFTTDENGKVSLVLPIGENKISAYAPGCLVRNLPINVMPGINVIPDIGLSDLSTYEAEVKHHVMSYEEIEDAGIDTEDPANHHVYKYELKLTFIPQVDEINILYYVNSNKEIIVPALPDVSTNVKWICDDENDGHFHIQRTDPETGFEEDIDIYPVSDNFYLIIRGDVHWLKEMFDVEMLIINNSMTDTLENLSATLKLPEGLSLAAMSDREQSLTQHVDKIAEGKTESVHWYVRGDREGSYGVEARLQGIIMPFGEPIDDLFVSDNQLQVLAGNALHLNFEFPGAAYYNEDYPIRITLTNTSDRTLYRLSHMVQVVQGMEVYYDDGTSYSRVDTSDWFGSEIIREFHPGDKLVIEIDVNIFFKSDALEKELLKLTDAVDIVEQYIKGYAAVDSVIDTAGSISVSITSCISALDEYIASFKGTASEKLLLLTELRNELDLLCSKYSSAGRSTVDMAEIVANTGIINSLDAIVSDTEKWMSLSTQRDISDLLSKVKVCSELFDMVSDDNHDKSSYDIFDALRTAVSSIPVRFVLTNVIMTESAENTTSIPWSYTITDSDSEYFSVSTVCEYLNTLTGALMEKFNEKEIPSYIRLIPNMDYPGSNTQLERPLKSVIGKDTLIKAKDATGQVCYTVYVIDGNNEVTSDSFRLSCDNSSAIYENGVLSFTGDAMISVTPLKSMGGTVRIEDSNGNVYDYAMEVVEEHECIAGDNETVINPTNEQDGFAVKHCTVCNEILEVINLLANNVCTDHTFGEWSVIFSSTEEIHGIKERVCAVCSFCETEILPLIHRTNSDGLEYVVENGRISITKYNGNATELKLPDYIDGHPVCYIGEYAFEGCESIVHIILPEKTAEIGTNAFANCTNLKSITLPDSNESILDGAFMNCTSLKNIIFTSSVTSIGSKAFFGCDSLTTVYFLGKEHDWATISFGNDNDPLLNATIIYSAPGDANSDGFVDGKDALLMATILAGAATLDTASISYLASDLDGDGTLSGKDVYILKRIIAGSYVA